MLLDKLTKPSLTKIHKKNKGKISDKWEKFLSVYEKTFEPIRNNKLSMLEIGIQNGGSLETWSRYFRRATSIIGCDINPKCGSLKYASAAVTVVVGDATQVSTYESIRKISPKFDIVIDDGSHVSKDIIDAFLLYFPMLTPGGIYCIEDTHTLYWEEFGGGLDNASNAKEFFKDLTDVINQEHWRTDQTIQGLITSRLGQRKIDFIAEGWVESIEFHNSLIIVRKAIQASHHKLGARLITGKLSQVDQASEKLRGKPASK